MSKLTQHTFIFLLISSSFYWLSFNYLDQPIAYFFHQHAQTGISLFLTQFITLLGDARVTLACTLILMAMAINVIRKQPQHRLANILLLTSIAMLIAFFSETALKFLLGRYRPEMLFHQGLYGFHYLTHEFLMTSMPSGHATRAFVLVTGFSLMYKRLAPLFLLIGLLVCLSRLVLGFHFLSDVIIGALLGTYITLWTAKIYFSITSTNLSVITLKPRL